MAGVLAGRWVSGRWVSYGLVTAVLFGLLAPRAGAICYARYELEINSSELAQRLKDEQSVLIVPGDHFGMDHFVRISFGLPHDYLNAALDRIHDLIEELKAE